MYQSQQSRHAIKTGIAAIVSVIIYHFYNLPQGYWAVITAIVIMQSNMDSGSLEVTLKLALQRLIGTVFGAVIGFGILLLLNPNYWQLLLVLFIVITVGAYINKLYSGLSLLCPTAAVVLLVAHQGSIGHNMALIRIMEIFLGAVVAILVTVCIWPYRISDYLKNHRKRILLLISRQFSSLMRIIDTGSVSTAWTSQQKNLFSTIRNDLKYLEMIKNEKKTKEQESLNMMLSLMKTLHKLGESATGLPKNYWEFGRLKEVTLSLIDAIKTGLNHLAKDKPSQGDYENLEKMESSYRSTFEKFRHEYKQPNYERFNMEQAYQVVATYRVLIQCSNIVLELISKEQASFKQS